MKNILIIILGAFFLNPLLAQSSELAPEESVQLYKNNTILVDEGRSEQITKAIKEHRSELLSIQSPYIGAQNGNVFIVEFFDYQCIHCKDMQPILESLIPENPQLKIIYKDLPIMGNNSNYAAKAALEAQNQGKYHQLHKRLLEQEKPLTQKSIINLAKEAGVNTRKLIDAIDYDENAVISSHFNLAKALSIKSTPSYLILNNHKAPVMIFGQTTAEFIQPFISD